MARHIMLDMETLDTAPSTVILTIGAASFDPLGMGVIDTIDLRPTIDEQTEIYNRTINEATMDWWSKQSPEAINEAMGDHDRIPYRDAMEKLYKFCWNADKVWANGSIFDIIIAENSFRELGMQAPWQFYNVRDCRTIYELAGVSLKDKKYGTKTTHKAVEDSIHQVLVVQDAYKKFIKAGFTHIR